MPKDITSPFTPGRPVPVEFFVGRMEEIERLRRKVRDAMTGRVEVAFVTGERGIGKSSLASFVRYVSERDERALGIHALMGGISTTEGMVRRVFNVLLKESREDELGTTIRSLFGKHVREVGLFGVSVEFRPEDSELQALADHFASALRNLLEKVKDRRRGILIVLDDINGLSVSAGFADWFKSLVDEISVSRQRLPLCLIMVGLDERRQSLIETQPSLARVFDVVPIRAWSDEESRSFFENAFEKAGTQCRGDALDLMAHFAGGLPALAHEIGDAVFAADSDDVIDHDDAQAGVVAAADIVGRRYLDPVVFKSIRSERYRKILRKIARGMRHERFTRARVRSGLPEDERKVIDNFLTRMKKLGVVVDDPEGGRGSYRFSTLLHYLYFAMEAERPG